MYNRFFAFGCSLTLYKWPTWADYLYAGGIADTYENWALPGGSNDFILHSIAECDRQNTIAPNDIVCIMWSQPHRISDYDHTKGWQLLGNAYLYQPKDRMLYYSPDKADIEAITFTHIVNWLPCPVLQYSIEPLLDLYSMAEHLGYDRGHDSWRETLPGDRHPSPREHRSFVGSLDLDLDITAMDKLCNAADEKIFGSKNPHQQTAIPYVGKYPSRKGGIDVSNIQPFNW